MTEKPEIREISPGKEFISELRKVARNDGAVFYFLAITREGEWSAVGRCTLQELASIGPFPQLKHKKITLGHSQKILNRGRLMNDWVARFGGPMLRSLLGTLLQDMFEPEEEEEEEDNLSIEDGPDVESE